MFDESGRFNPTYKEDETITVKADTILLSIGQGMDWGNLLKDSKIQLNRNNTVKADAKTLQTDEPDVFAGGDVLTGPKFAIDAIALGKEGAISIHRYVQPGQSLIIGRDRKEYHALNKENLEIQGYDDVKRQSAAHVDSSKSSKTFKDLRGTLTEEQMKMETQRCLSCGATIVDEFLCVGCGQCTTKCKFDAISLVRKYDGEGVAYEDLKPVVIKQVLKRKVKITAKKVTKLFK